MQVEKVNTCHCVVLLVLILVTDIDVSAARSADEINP